MSEIWIVIVQDRHTDTDALPYTTEEAAVAKARAIAREYAWHPEDAKDGTLNAEMRRDGWVLWLPYGTEGDSVRVVRREMDAP